MVRILNQERSYRGSGFVVGERAILTCAHVLSRDEPDSLQVELQRDGHTVLLPIAQVLHRWQAPRLAHEADDIAVLLMAAALELEPSVLVQGLDPGTLRAWSGRLQVHGFGGSAGHSGASYALSLRGGCWTLPSGLVRTAQLDGHLPAGLSGSPVLIHEPRNGFAAVGMVFLGGQGHAHATFYGSDLLIEHLGAHGLCPRVGTLNPERRVRTVDHVKHQEPHAEGMRWMLVSAAADELAAERVQAALMAAQPRLRIERLSFPSEQAPEEALREPLRRSPSMIVLVSAANQAWFDEAWLRAMADQQVVVIPACIPPLEVPATLRARPYLDLATSPNDGLSQLIALVRAETTPLERSAGVSLGSATRGELRKIVMSCVSELEFRSFLFDFDIPEGRIPGASLHERLVNLLLFLRDEDLIDRLVTWVECERPRCVAKKLAELRA